MAEALGARPRDEGTAAALALALAAISLGYALEVSNGTLQPLSIAGLTAAGVLCIAALANPRIPVLERLGELPVVWVVGVGIAFQLWMFLRVSPGSYLRVTGDDVIWFYAGIVVAAFLAGGALSRDPWLGKLQVPLLLFTHFLLGVWLISASPAPFIDVYAWHKEAFRVLRSGIDPYSISMPNIYGNVQFYDPGLLANGRVQVGFQYPPLSLFLAWLGHLLAGDYRYANLAAMTGSGALMAYCRPRRLGAAAAVLFLFTPRVLFVLEQGWTEPYVLLLFSGVIFAAARFPKALPYLLGLLIAVKQYALLAVPLAFLLLPPPFALSSFLKLLGRAVLVALVVTLPMALWDARGFVNSVLLFQIRQPFRTDALSYLAWVAARNGTRLPSWLGFALTLPALAFGAWRAPRAPAGYAAGVSLVLLVFFAFNKQAFCNYYYLVVGTLCWAVAAIRPPSAELPVGAVDPAQRPS